MQYEKNTARLAKTMDVQSSAFSNCDLFNPLKPGQFTRRVYRLPGAIRDNVPVSVSVSVSFFWQRKFR